MKRWLKRSAQFRPERHPARKRSGFCVGLCQIFSPSGRQRGLLCIDLRQRLPRGIATGLVRRMAFGMLPDSTHSRRAVRANFPACRENFLRIRNDAIERRDTGFLQRFGAQCCRFAWRQALAAGIASPQRMPMPRVASVNAAALVAEDAPGNAAAPAGLPVPAYLCRQHVEHLRLDDRRVAVFNIF